MILLRQRYSKTRETRRTRNVRLFTFNYLHSIIYNFTSQVHLRIYLELCALQEQGIVSLQDIQELQQDPDLQILVNTEPTVWETFGSSVSKFMFTFYAAFIRKDVCIIFIYLRIDLEREERRQNAHAVSNGKLRRECM